MNSYPNLSAPQFEPWTISLYNETEKETQSYFLLLHYRKKIHKKRFMLFTVSFTNERMLKEVKRVALILYIAVSVLFFHEDLSTVREQNICPSSG